MIFLIRDVETRRSNVAGRHGIQIIFVLPRLSLVRKRQGHAGRASYGRPRASPRRPIAPGGAPPISSSGPLLERCGQERASIAWDIINEPEWITTVKRGEIDAFSQ
jgi:hypothetical protein